MHMCGNDKDCLLVKCYQVQSLVARVHAQQHEAKVAQSNPFLAKQATNQRRGYLTALTELLAVRLILL